MIKTNHKKSTKVQESCPKCGNETPMEEQGLVFYYNTTREESDRLNYFGSLCQRCGFRWNKYGEEESKEGKA